MAVSVVLMSAFVVGELIAGLFAHSLALLSDAGHNFADVPGVAAGVGMVFVPPTGPVPPRAPSGITALESLPR